MDHIEWEDCCTNASILTETKITSIEAMIVQNQLWHLYGTGHCVRLTPTSLNKSSFPIRVMARESVVGGESNLKNTLDTYLKKRPHQHDNLGGLGW